MVQELVRLCKGRMLHMQLLTNMVAAVLSASKQALDGIC
jgi:hypothetical protein